MTEERKRLMTLLCEAHNIACDAKLFDDATYAQQLGKEADHLLANGVRLETEQATSDENKRIEGLETQLAEREKAVIQLRKQWQDAEMHICTMCGHFDHKTDGNIVYGNKTCGEICGYPFCKEKFTPWIPVTERLPEKYTEVIAFSPPYSDYLIGFVDVAEDEKSVTCFGDGVQLYNVTHWMPLPEPPKEK